MEGKTWTSTSRCAARVIESLSRTAAVSGIMSVHHRGEMSITNAIHALCFSAGENFCCGREREPGHLSMQTTLPIEVSFGKTEFTGSVFACGGVGAKIRQLKQPRGS